MKLLKESLAEYSERYSATDSSQVFVVSCKNCGMTMWSVSDSALVHDDGNIYCKDCCPPSDADALEAMIANPHRTIKGVVQAFVGYCLEELGPAFATPDPIVTEVWGKLKGIREDLVPRCGYCGGKLAPEGWHCPHCGGC